MHLYVPAHAWIDILILIELRLQAFHRNYHFRYFIREALKIELGRPGYWVP